MFPVKLWITFRESLFSMFCSTFVVLLSVVTVYSLQHHGGTVMMLSFFRVLDFFVDAQRLFFYIFPSGLFPSFSSPLHHTGAVCHSPSLYPVGLASSLPGVQPEVTAAFITHVPLF